MERAVSAEIPGTVKAQVDVQHERVVKLQEEMLPVRGCTRQDVPVQQGGTGREPPLRARDREALPREDVAELARQPVDRMPFRHYSMTSPVRS